MTKRLWLLPIILLGVASTGARNSRPQPASGDDGILIANERTLLGAVAKADKTSFSSLVVADGVWTTPQGFVPMNLLANGLDAFSLSKWDIVNPRVLRLNDDAAVVVS